MRRLGKVLGIIGIVLLVLVVVASTFVAWTVRRSFPQTSGTIALVPFDDYQRNRDWLRAIPVDGYLPSPVNIVNEDYTLVNPVLIFVRNTALAKAPAQAWLMEALREETIGPGNYLVDFGFQILPTAMREDQRKWLSHLESE